ncbi:sensor histidine kinase [Streptomyces fuscichromogenes]|uniref:sensor histidine kinase n=1 Tax=Streptomyces fuscichromogenes TaxID=1324013 RepID=UPI00382CF76E
MSYGLAVPTPETDSRPGQVPPPPAPPRPVPGQDPRAQWALTLAVIVSGALTIRPMGVSGQGLLVAVLFVLNCAALLARGLPSDRIPPAATLVWLSLGVLAAAALIGASRSGTGYLFAFFLSGHIGYRLPARQALVLAPACSLLCGGVLYFDIGGSHPLLPWAVGLTTGAPVLVGILNRVQHQAVNAALSAAQSAERAARAEAQAAVLTERSRIARDVHDVLAHTLAGINMQLELADALLDTGDLEKVRAANDKAHSLVKESLKQAQWTVHALREDSLPLVQTLTAMLESSGHHNTLTVHGTPIETPARVTQNLLRIAQESLTNAARHAPGGQVRAELAFTTSSTTLTIRNRHATRPAHTGQGSGMGLIGIRERVSLLGGTLTTGPVTEGPDQGGWHVKAVIPR